MARREKWHGSRALLNKPGYQSTAAIVAEIEDSSTWKANCDADGDPLTSQYVNVAPTIALQFANCDRAITYDFDGFQGSPGDQLNANQANDLYKLDLMIDALTKFRAGVALEHARYRDRKAAHARLKKDAD